MQYNRSILFEPVPSVDDALLSVAWPSVSVDVPDAIPESSDRLFFSVAEPSIPLSSKKFGGDGVAPPAPFPAPPLFFFFFFFSKR